MATNTSTFDELLAPGLRKLYDTTTEERPEEYKMFTNSESTKRAYEEDLTLVGLGTTPEKPQGSNTVYDDPEQGDKKTYTMISYGLGFRITHEMWADDLYGQMNKFPKMLARSNNDVVERIAADMLNSGFEALDALPRHRTANGEAIFDDAHTQPGTTTTYDNQVATDMSITALQTMTNWFETELSGRGLRMRMKPSFILVPPQLRFTMREIFKTTQGKPFTADNEVNSILDEDLKWGVSHYLTDDNSWFAFSDNKSEHWPNFFWREKASFENGFDFDSGDAKFKTFLRFECGVAHARGLYGSAGAS